MKRKELFEFEDFEWLPSVVRFGITNLIIVFHRLMGTAQVISRLIVQVREQHHFTQITDLGSGSGGPMPEVITILNADHKIEELTLLLSDKYPSPQVIEETNNKELKNVKYSTTSIDAQEIGKAPKGLKTMIASFHHMNPTTAKSILRSAQENREPLLIYEVAKNNIAFIVWLVLLPVSLVILILMSLVMTPFVRPLSIGQMVFTYIIPLIPLIYAWDGQASLMRTYTFDDIRSLLEGHEQSDYHWEISDAKNEKGKKVGYYIMGYPK